ncbi:MAG: virulence RhuM family protein [Chloroflexi bacterium]|nr:virulence RhuM family protein [Chloroflexota bacterium]
MKLNEQETQVDNQLILYQTADGETRIQVTMQDGTVWLTQKQMVELFQRDKSVVSRHVNNVFKEGELERESNMQFLHIANSDKPVAFYNLDVVISVGYRAKSHRGTQFRIWATKTVREYLVKGFVIDDDPETAQAQEFFATCQNKIYFASQWVTQLDDFFRFNRRAALQHKGKVSRQDMEAKVREELRKYREQSNALESGDE